MDSEHLAAPLAGLVQRYQALTPALPRESCRKGIEGMLGLTA